MRVQILALSILVAGTAHAVDPPFDVPWIGYDTGTYPQLFPSSAQVGDLNGDGFPDLAAVNYGGNAWLSILFADGAGGYLPPETYPISIESVDLAMADFDNDGDLDIVTSDSGRFWEGHSVSLYLNDGVGTFEFAGEYSIGNTGPAGITAADFDGDGWIDVATANERYIECNNTVSVLLNNDGNGFASAAVYTISSCTHEIDSGDLNGDGHPDLVIAHNSNRYTIMMNNGEGGFGVGPVVTGLTAGSIPLSPNTHIADVDLDGHLDIFFTNRDTGGVGAGGVGLWRNDGEGGFPTGELLSFAWYNNGGIDVHTSDVTADGWPDIMCATGNGNWFLLESDGRGGFNVPRKLRAGQNTGQVHTPDLDQDGDLDLCVLSPLSMEVCVYRNPGHGEFVQPVPLDFADPALAPAFTTNIEAGDIDADGDLDLVVGFRSDFEETFGITVRRNQGDGTFGPRETYEEIWYPVWVRLRDLDGDADLDLIWVEDDGRFRRRFNDGAGNFGPRQNSATISQGSYFDLYDIDNDGDLDAVAAAGFYAAVLRNNGGGAFAAPTWNDIGAFYNVLGMGDYNHDAVLDLLTDSAAQGYPQISFGNGDGTFAPPFTVSTGRDVHSFGVADLDDDGNLDFAAPFNLDEQGISIRRGRPDGNFHVPVHSTGSFIWADHSDGARTNVIDVDGDGIRDIVFPAIAAQEFTFWKGVGDGTFERAIRCGVGHPAHDAITADFTGDGVIDVALSTQIDAGRWWYTGVQIIEGIAGATPLPGDIDGDGAVDFQDLLALLAAWGPCGDPCPEDVDGDGVVDFNDLLLVLANWS